MYCVLSNTPKAGILLAIDGVADFRHLGHMPDGTKAKTIYGDKFVKVNGEWVDDSPAPVSAEPDVKPKKKTAPKK